MHIHFKKHFKNIENRKRRLFHSNRSRLIACIVLILLVCTENITYSKEIGKKINITPSITGQAAYDSNIFKLKNKERVQALANESRMDDFITNYLAELEVDYSTNNKRLTINGSKNFVRFAHYKDLDYESDFLAGKAELDTTAGFFINPAYTYSKDPIARRYNITRREQDFLEYKDALIDGGYKANEWEVAILMGRTHYNYALSDTLNRRVTSYGASLTIIPSKKTQWYLRTVHKQLEFEGIGQQNDNKVTDILLGASFIFTAKNLFKIEGGRREKRFAYAKEREFEGFIGNLSLTHQLSPDTDFMLRLARNTDTSYYRGATYYVDNSVYGKFNWQISHKVSTHVSALHRWTDYKGTSDAMPIEWQKYLVLEWGLTHTIHDNVQVSLSYEFQQQDANNDSWEFKAHQVTAGLLLTWN